MYSLLYSSITVHIFGSFFSSKNQISVVFECTYNTSKKNSQVMRKIVGKFCIISQTAHTLLFSANGDERSYAKNQNLNKSLTVSN